MGTMHKTYHVWAKEMENKLIWSCRIRALWNGIPTHVSIIRRFVEAQHIGSRGNFFATVIEFSFFLFYFLFACLYVCMGVFITFVALRIQVVH